MEKWPNFSVQLRNLHMFLDILELGVETKHKFKKKNVIVMWSQICGNMALRSTNLLKKKVGKKTT